MRHESARQESVPAISPDLGETVKRAHNAATAESVAMEWLGLKQLTRYAAVCERTLRGWIYSPVDPLPAVRVRGKVLVRRTDFDDYLRRHAVRPIDLSGTVKQVVDDVLGRR